jgi:hypothetical protein
MSCETNIATVILVIFVAFIIIWLVQESEEKYGSVQASNSFGYAQLNGAYNNQLFYPFIGQKCLGGDYMFSSNPKMIDDCKKCAPNYYGKNPCGVSGVQGTPINFDYSSLSDSKNNKICNGNFQTSLCSL